MDKKNEQIPSSVWNDYAKKNNFAEVGENITVDSNMAQDLIERSLADRYGISAEEIKNFKENADNEKFIHFGLDSTENDKLEE